MLLSISQLSALLSRTSDQSGAGGGCQASHSSHVVAALCAMEAHTPKLINVLERLRKVNALSTRRRSDTGQFLQPPHCVHPCLTACLSYTVCLLCACCQSGPMALMAEIKRASPSLGDINTSIDPAQQAITYAKGGAAVISVLTEPKWSVLHNKHTYGHLNHE